MNFSDSKLIIKFLTLVRIDVIFKSISTNFFFLSAIKIEIYKGNFLDDPMKTIYAPIITNYNKEDVNTRSYATMWI